MVNVKKILFDKREIIITIGFAAGIAGNVGVVDSFLETELIAGIKGKFILAGAIGVGFFTFQSFYKVDYLRKVYGQRKQLIAPSPLPKTDTPPPEPPEKYKAKDTDKFKFVPMDQQNQASKKIMGEFNKPMTKENKDIVPEVPKSLKPKTDAEKYDIPDLSEGTKHPDVLRKEREAKKKQPLPFEVKEPDKINGEENGNPS